MAPLPPVSPVQPLPILSSPAEFCHLRERFRAELDSGFLAASRRLQDLREAVQGRVSSLRIVTELFDHGARVDVAVFRKGFSGEATHRPVQGFDEVELERAVAECVARMRPKAP